MRQMVELQEHGITPRPVGADRAYCSSQYIEGQRSQSFVPHSAPMKDRRLLCLRVGSKAHQLSQAGRPKIDEIFGWPKTGAAALPRIGCGYAGARASGSGFTSF